MKKWINILLFGLLAFPAGVYVLSYGKSTNQASVARAESYFAADRDTQAPCEKADGDRFTIGYVDLDPYPATGEMLYWLVEQLKETGWITYHGNLPFDPEYTDAKALIDYLAAQDLGKYIRFSRDINYYISESYDGREYVRKDLRRHIKRKEVDLIFCQSTVPADFLVNEMKITQVPVMVFGIVDPVRAGIAKSEEYSGRENVWCHTNIGLYTNQLKFYYHSRPFQNIGMVFYKEAVAAYQPYQDAADELGFRITVKKTDGSAGKGYYKRLAALYQDLIREGIDAFLLNSDMIKDERKAAPLLDMFIRHGIPVFVQTSEYYVEDGALMLVATSDAKAQAPFLADTFASILHGTQPGSISQKFVTPPYLSLNLDTADRIGYPIRTDMLLSAENIYTSAAGEAVHTWED